jgi:hypothetical protein
MCRSVLTANEKMGDSIVLVFTENHEALLSEGMKRVRDSYFACQNSGIMSCLPMPEDAAPRSYSLIGTALSAEQRLISLL